MTKKIETPIPLYVAIAFNHMKKAEKAHENMKREFANVCSEHIEKGTLDTSTLGNLLAYGVVRRPDGYYIVHPDWSDEDAG